MSAVESPGLAGVEESGEFHCTVNLQLRAGLRLMPFCSQTFSDLLTVSSDVDAGLSNPVDDFTMMYNSLESVLQ